MIAQKAMQLYEEYVENYILVIAEMSSLNPNQQSFLQNMLPLPPLISRATQIQQEEGDK